MHSQADFMDVTMIGVRVDWLSVTFVAPNKESIASANCQIVLNLRS